MTEDLSDVLARQIAAATALAQQHNQPAYVLAAAEGDEKIAATLLWVELNVADWVRIAAIILPDGTRFERSSTSVEVVRLLLESEHLQQSYIAAQEALEHLRDAVLEAEPIGRVQEHGEEP
jgi:hypothetical protein